MPIYATIFVITTMSSIGLPFLNGFVGEFLIMVGMLKSNVLRSHGTVQLELYRDDACRHRRHLRRGLSACGWSSAYFLARSRTTRIASLTDSHWREIGLMLPLLVLMVYMGVYPRPFLDTYGRCGQGDSGTR